MSFQQDSSCISLAVTSVIDSVTDGVSRARNLNQENGNRQNWGQGGQREAEALETLPGPWSVQQSQPTGVLGPHLGLSQLCSCSRLRMLRTPFHGAPGITELRRRCDWTQDPGSRDISGA